MKQGAPAPLRLDHDRYVCDSCMHAAQWVVPFAFLCGRCLPSYGTDPVALAISPNGRARREAEYRRLAATAPLYTLEEEILLDSPIPCSEQTCCDVVGCAADAEWLVDGGAFCEECAEGFGLAGGGMFDVPIAVLTGGDEWRQARSTAYRAELARLIREEPVPRSAGLDTKLAANVARRVDAMIDVALRLRPGRET
jgi:hypothetical protein